MSRGFVKEEDQEEAPIIPPRAALPPGAVNYVTPNGLEQLKAEKDALEKERTALSADTNETERRRAQMLIDGKIRLLNERIHSARVLNPSDQPVDEVRFGARVKLKPLQGGAKGLINFTIVGVDEASVKDSKVAFVAPIARAITGKKTGEVAELQLAGKNQRLQIVEIHYP